MIVGTVTSKGQTTIPKTVRQELGLVEGSRIGWEVKDGKAFIVARGPRRAIELAGILAVRSGDGLAPDEIDEAIAEALAKDDERISREWHESRK